MDYSTYLFFLAANSQPQQYEEAFRHKLLMLNQLQEAFFQNKAFNGILKTQSPPLLISPSSCEGCQKNCMQSQGTPSNLVQNFIPSEISSPIILKEQVPKRTKRDGQCHKRPTNDTKNIPKNFGSAICTYIKKNSPRVKKILQLRKLSYPRFMEITKKMKEDISSIHDLREVWNSSEEDCDVEYKACFRIFSQEFIRRHSLNHIFTSRIRNVSSHIKYRSKLLEALRKPSQLTNLKDF